MTTYVFYNKANGEIVHTHREYYMDSEKASEISEDELYKVVKDLLPRDKDIHYLTVAEDLKPVRGYKFYVDLTLNDLIKIEKPIQKKEKS